VCLWGQYSLGVVSESLGFLKVSSCSIIPTKFLILDAPIVVGIGELWLELYGLVVVLYGALVLSQFEVDQAPVRAL